MSMEDLLPHQTKSCPDIKFVEHNENLHILTISGLSMAEIYSMQGFIKKQLYELKQSQLFFGKVDVDINFPCTEKQENLKLTIVFKSTKAFAVRNIVGQVFYHFNKPYVESTIN